MPAPIFRIIHNAPRKEKMPEIEYPEEQDTDMGLSNTLDAIQFYPKPVGNHMVLNKSRTCIKQEEQYGLQDTQSPKEFNKPNPAKLARIAEFRALNAQRVASGQLYCQSLKNI